MTQKKKKKINNLLHADVDIQGIPEKIDVAKQGAKIWTLFRSWPT